MTFVFVFRPKMDVDFRFGFVFGRKWKILFGRPLVYITKRSWYWLHQWFNDVSDWACEVSNNTRRRHDSRSRVDCCCTVESRSADNSLYTHYTHTYDFALMDTVLNYIHVQGDVICHWQESAGGVHWTLRSTIGYSICSSECRRGLF